MDPAGSKGAVVVVEHPPLALVAAVRDCRIAAELRRITARPDPLDHLCGEQATAVDHALVQHQKAKPGQIAQAEIEAAARKGHTLSVDCLIGVLLCPHGAPQAGGCECCHGLPGYAADDPAQHVRVDGPVMERLAVPALGLHLRKVLPVAVRAVLALGFRERAGGSGIAPDIGGRISIVFREPDPRGHVHDLSDRRAAKGAARDLGNEVPDQSAVVQRALGHQDLGQKAGHGLGHRHCGVLAVFGQASEVALIDHAALVKHKNAVRVVGVKRGFPRHRLILTHGHKGQAIDPGAEIGKLDRRGVGQWNRCVQAAADLLGGQELPQVADRPSEPGKAEVDRLGLGDDLVLWRRKALHPAHDGGIGVLR